MVLYANVGSGHKMAAKAVAAALKEKGVPDENGGFEPRRVCVHNKHTLITHAAWWSGGRLGIKSLISTRASPSCSRN